MMPIGEVARQAGLNTSAIRYYERVGLLAAPERSSGRRRYGPDVLARLTVIRFARDNGFTVREIRDLLTGRPYSTRLRTLARERIRSLDLAIAQARAMQAVLRSALRCHCLDVTECGRRLSRAAPRSLPRGGSGNRLAGASRRCL